MSPVARARTARASLVTAASVAALLVLSAVPGCAQEPADAAEDRPYRIVTVVQGLEHPWSLAFLPGGDILITERAGRVRLVRGGELVERAVEGVPEVRSGGQGGLLDVALHPDFGANRLVYLSFSKPGPQGATTAVVRGRLEGDRLEDVEEILEADAWASGGAHFGSRLVFDAAGFLYVTIGDRGRMERAQDPTDHAGTTLRLHDDGRVPEDNPFVDDPDVRDEIFSYGHRNAQGMVVHSETGEIWQNEHGPRGGDEINRVLPGRNYGWPEITHGVHYDGRVITERTEAPGLESPLLHWTPSIAPSGKAIYTGSAFPAWQGDIFVGALANRHVRRVRFRGAELVEHEVLLAEHGRRIRDVRQGPDGFLYLLEDERNAALLRLEPR